PGDINEDGKVNLRDVIRLNQFVAGWNVKVNEGAKDVNGDGKVNLRDVIRLNQYVAGWDVNIY
ncbi:dockerin type I repeat-containing protein, partial [Ruminococcus sp. zg-921]